MKRGLARWLEWPDLEQHLRYELANIQKAFAGDDATEALKASFEKRKPVFHGR